MSLCRYPASFFLLLLLSLQWSSTTAAAAEDCLKQVYGHYCLGGDFDSLLRQPRQPLHQQRETNRQAAIYREGRERIYVMAYQGRIYKVVRQYQPATQLQFEDLESVLRDKYGPGEDVSKYPSYATSRGLRVASIRRGEGRAARVWHATPVWRVELSWTREMGVALSYVANELDQELRKAMERGL